MSVLAATVAHRQHHSPTVESGSNESRNFKPGHPAGLPLFLQRRIDPSAEPREGILDEEELGPIQAKLLINEPGDPFEQEADAVAQRAVNGAGAGEFSLARNLATQEIVQRKCAGCASGAPCAECAEEEQDQPVQRKASGAVSSPALGMCGRILHPPDAGSALGPEIRGRIEPILGADLGAVRVHSSPRAQTTASQLGAKAFTHGNNIWLGPTQSTDDLSLLAHEATHVVQQDAAPRVESAKNNSPKAASTEVPQIQRDDEPGLLDRALSYGEDTLASAADLGGEALASAADLGEEALDSALRMVSPELADMVAQGPVAFVKDLIERAIGEWLPALLGGFDPVGAASEFVASIGEAFGTLAGLVKGEAKSCEAFASMLGGLRSLGTAIMESTAVQMLRDALSSVYAAIEKVVQVVAAPVLDAVADLLGSAWSAIKGAATRIWGWIQSAKDLAGRAWDWAAEKLGLVGAEGEEGILDWIKRKAGEVWDSIKETFAPAIGPLKKVVAGLSMFTGLGEIYLLVKYGPQLVDAVTWLWEHRNEPDIIATAHEQMKDSILPQLLDGVAGFKGVLDSAIDWLVGIATSLSQDLLELLGGISGVPLLSLAQDAIQTVANAASQLMAWGQTQLTAAGQWFLAAIGV